MTVQTANDGVPGVRTFRCRSDRDPSTWYTVKRIRRPASVRGPVIRNRWMCSCPDYMNRKVLDNLHCKHIKRVRSYAMHVGGVSRIPRGTTLDIPEGLPPKLRLPKEPKHAPTCKRLSASGQFIFPDTKCSCGAAERWKKIRDRQK